MIPYPLERVNCFQRAIFRAYYVIGIRLRCHLPTNRTREIERHDVQCPVRDFMVIIPDTRFSRDLEYEGIKETGIHRLCVVTEFHNDDDGVEGTGGRSLRTDKPACLTG